MKRPLVALIITLFTAIEPLPSAYSYNQATSSYCFRNYLRDITPNEHRPAEMVRPLKIHIMREGSLYRNATLEEQVNYVSNMLQEVPREEVEFILKSVFEHPQATENTRVVFGGSRVRGNAKAASDLDVGVYGFENNPLNKLIKKVNDRVERGEFKIPLEKTKIMNGNETPSIPKIISPEEFFLRTGQVSHTTDELKQFVPSGFISIGKDGTIVQVPAPKLENLQVAH